MEAEDACWRVKRLRKERFLFVDEVYRIGTSLSAGGCHELEPSTMVALWLNRHSLIVLNLVVVR